MVSIFNKTNNLFENPNRNTFDLSFQNNLTLNMGELVPVICKECLPGDTWRVDPTISLRMMPLLFPVQTRLRAHLHFFYVTNRSLWKDWQDFIGNTRESLEMPYIRNDFKTGSLGDYLGLPTTVSKGTPRKDSNKWWSGSYINILSNGLNFENGPHYSFNLSPQFGSSPTPILYSSLMVDRDLKYEDFASIFDEINYSLGFTGSESYLPSFDLSDTNNYKYSNKLPHAVNSSYRNFNATIRNGALSIDSHLLTSSSTNVNFAYYCPDFNLFPVDDEGNELSSFRFFEQDPGLPGIFDDDFSNTSQSVQVVFTWINKKNGKRQFAELYVSKANVESGLSQKIHESSPSSMYTVYNIGENDYASSKMDLASIRELGDKFQCILIFRQYSINGLSSQNGFGYLEYFSERNFIAVHKSLAQSFNYYVPASDVEDWSDPNGTLKINALPFRAYEAIYNSFYRDERNNPLMENGEPIYNKWILNDSGGLDGVVNKELYKRNWQSDFLTTAVQSPQQGVAPLVGITARGEISFRDEDTGEIYTAKLNTSNGDAIDSFTVTSPNMPQGNLRQLVDFASSGISISDLRGVNALQRWLEINMRRGLRYKDQIKSHFGVDVRYDELMMPEFIGGISTDIYVNQINQTTPTDGQPLGWFAGQGGAFESAKHSINHYCQEHGYIIGILSIEPTPQYSQLLPKHYLKSQLLDYYFPEFGHLGMQPILYSEVAPNETLYSGQDLNDTFGYQRAWYDYLASTDEVHGLFRTTLSNFVVQRMFDGRPELSKSFLTIDPKTLDSVFAVESGTDSHKFLGQVYFDIKCKRPIPEYGIPKLEV